MAMMAPQSQRRAGHTRERSPRPDRAIAIARKLGIPLKMAAKIDRVDEAYFKAQIAP
jgi:hypothetical protein